MLLVDRNGAKLDEARQRLAGLGAVETIIGDLNDLALVATAVARAKERFGGLDALLNAAGSTERCGLDDTTPEAYERIFNLNVRAPLFMMQEAVKLMRPARRGTIVNVALGEGEAADGSAGPGMGVAFTDMDDDTRARIARFVAAHAEG